MSKGKQKSKTSDSAQVQAQATMAMLGAVPVTTTLPGSVMFDKNCAKVGKAMKTPEYQELVAKRKSGELSREEFLTALKSLVNELDEAGRLD